LGSFFENNRSSPHFLPTFSTVNVMHPLWQKWVGLQFGPIFYKLVWSPCCSLILILSFAPTNSAAAGIMALGSLWDD
jgi:hypothetical protein